MRGGGKSNSIISDLIDVQIGLREDLNAMAVVVAQKDIEIIVLKAISVKEEEERISLMGMLNVKTTDLHEKVKKLKEKVEVLTRKNQDLAQYLLKAHAAKIKRMTILLR